MFFDPAHSSAATHAIIVAGHAIITDFSDPLADESWMLLPFQKGEPRKYVEHIRAGVELAAADPASLLVFSGGQTRREAGPRSEAQSYFWIAGHYGWFGHPEVAARAITEEFARDSFENLLFGICRFRECTSRYPDRVTFVSWKFKRERFELHRAAILWPRERFSYYGVNDPDDIAQALAAEQQTAAGYAADPYSSFPEFEGKRQSRNPFLRQHGYFISCPEAAALFLHRGPERFAGPLPWSPYRNI
jgi:hypothetical protein